LFPQAVFPVDRRFQVGRRNVDRIDSDYQIRELGANLLDFMMARDLEKSAQVH
jgi:hypothetical protein